MAEPKFTQEDLNERISFRVNEVKASAEASKQELASNHADEIKRLKESTGLTSKELSDKLAAQTTEYEAAKTSMTELTEKANKADELTLQIANRDMQDNLVAKGVANEYKGDVLNKLKTLGLLEVEEGKELDLDAALETVKEKYPFFFADAKPDLKSAGAGHGGKPSANTGEKHDPRKSGDYSHMMGNG